ncbi:uncharacterized protein DUF2628 [Marinobacter sp. LV10R520-4]|uniref:DUF2628 domain-containing protein n=1 Tax=Marinobacter sp. LV10R520-4 TaxID=1761796 RepID=UPI000BF3017A|nr:DUF2628 domain-containing protein [Marinobacter sp. LV10R520-4]PFG51513.1 uncharacterized protein DUF2628 [Marinobacter sp. LV10R520-4]
MTETVSTENRDLLNVSNSWKTRFKILQKIGADKQFVYKAMSSKEYKELSFKEKSKISFNILAFLFGPLYYFSKKMWVKGAAIVGATWVLAVLLTLVEAAIGTALPAVLYWIPSAVICAQLANYDYFRKVMHDEKMWHGSPKILSKPAGAIGFPLVALIFLFGASTFGPTYVEETRSQTLADVSGVWRGNTDGAMITISLAEKTKDLNINGTRIPVTVQSVDQENHVVTLGVDLANGQQASWALRQLFDQERRFTLQMTLHDGTQDGLSFVRDL